MAIFKRNAIKHLRHIGLRINRLSDIRITTLTHVSGVSIPVSLQISDIQYIECLPYTYNVDDNVIVVFNNLNDIFFVPNVADYEEIIKAEGYILDNNIYIPNIHSHTLEIAKHRRKWDAAKRHAAKKQ